MPQFEIALLTDSRYVHPTSTDEYVQNILLEDRLVRTAFEKRGLSVTRVDWADKNFDWSSTQCAVFRTTWDYFLRFEEFSLWLNGVSKKTRLINPVELIRWNIDKHYLNDLQKNGINIPPTRFIEPRENITLKHLHEDMGWNETVLKPTVSGGAFNTFKMNTKNLAEHENIFQRLIAKESMMLQPYLTDVETHGEIALMVIGGKFTHAILKKAKPGDFRVQDDFGGTVHHYNASPEEIVFAEKVVSVCNPIPLYARVDVILDNDGKRSVSELEVIEPELWFRFAPDAAENFGEAIAGAL